MFVMARSVWLAVLAALAAIPAAKLFGAAPKVQLFINNVTPGTDSVVGDFTPPAYTGYTDIAAVLSGPYTDPDGNCFEVVGDVTFTVTTTGESAIIMGFILKDSVLGYLGGVKFDTPINVAAPTGALIVGQNVKLDPTQLLGPPDVD